MIFNEIIISTLNVLFILILFYLFKKIHVRFATRFSLIDKPHKEKLHKISTPLTAAFPIFAIFLIYHVSHIFLNSLNININLLLISGLLTFIIGVIDDRYNLGYLLKFILFGIVIFLVIFFSKEFLLQDLYFDTFSRSFNLNIYASYFVTILCILLLINATNLSDGINGLCLGIILVWLLYLNVNFNLYLNFIPMLIIILFSFIYNYKGDFFLGNSGSHFLGTFISLLTIYQYNLSLVESNEKNITSVETIFILFMLPGIDMLRLFILRIFNKKNPFSSDLSHLHHYLIKKFSLKVSLFIYFVSMLTPILLNQLTNIDNYLIITLFTFYYISLLYLITKKKV